MKQISSSIQWLNLIINFNQIRDFRLKNCFIWMEKMVNRILHSVSCIDRSGHSKTLFELISTELFILKLKLTVPFVFVPKDTSFAIWWTDLRINKSTKKKIRWIFNQLVYIWNDCIWCLKRVRRKNNWNVRNNFSFHFLFSRAKWAVKTLQQKNMNECSVGEQRKSADIIITIITTINRNDFLFSFFRLKFFFSFSHPILYSISSFGFVFIHNIVFGRFFLSVVCFFVPWPTWLCCC